MAIRVTLICDTCGSEHEQIIDQNQEVVEYEIAFQCSDCILREGRALAKAAEEAESSEFVDATHIVDSKSPLP